MSEKIRQTSLLTEVEDIASRVDIQTMASKLADLKEKDPSVSMMRWAQLYDLFESQAEKDLIDILKNARPEQLGRTGRAEAAELDPFASELVSFRQPYVGANGKNYDPLPKTLPRHVYDKVQGLKGAYNEFLSGQAHHRPGLIIVSGYRSPAYQAGLHISAFAHEGISSSLHSIALPCESEHGDYQHTAVDFTAIGDVNGQIHDPYQKGKQVFEDYQEFEWLLEHAPEHGFALTYFPDASAPSGSMTADGFLYEPWHWRYLGPEKAIAFMQGDNQFSTNVYDVLERRLGKQAA